MLNQIIIMGRLVKDPELRYANETPVCMIRIACDRDYKNAEGKKEADFFDVVSWRKLAEIVSQYAAKGRMVSVVGRLQTRTWNDRDGNKRSSTEIVADHVYFCDPKPKDQNGQGAQNAQNSNAASNAQSGGYGQRNGYANGGYAQGSGYGGGYAQPSGYSNAGYNAGVSGYGNGAMGGYGSGATGGYNVQNAAASANNSNAAYANGVSGRANAYAAPPDGVVPNFQDEGVVPEFKEEDGDLPF